MKQILIILGLFASVTTFAQSPRIKLNQITKDTVKGSVLISSPSDSGMVYSRDFYIAYGADTVLILYGDTLAATSGIISSVLSDGVTITGNGTSGNELKVDTLLIATIKALNDSLATISASTTPDNVTITGDGSVGNPLKVDTFLISTIQGLVDTLSARGYLTANQTITLSGDVTGSGTTAITATVVDDSHNHIISNVDFLQDSLDAKANDSDLANYVTLSGTDTITGAKTFTNTFTQSGGDANFDSGTLFVDESANRVGISTTSPSTKLHVYTTTKNDDIGHIQYENANTGTGNATNAQLIGKSKYGTIQYMVWENKGARIGMRDTANSSAGDLYFTVGTDNVSTAMLSNGNVGIGTTTPSYKLDVNGDVRADTYYYDVGSSLVSSSDARLKTNIQSMNNVSDKLKSLNLIKYEWNDIMYKKLEGRTSQSKLGGTFEGMIAQQVESIFPEYVGIDKDGYKTLSYVSFIVPLIKGFQEQQAEIDQLKTLITDLTNRLIILENK